MPSSINLQRENSMLLPFKKKSGKWTKRNVVIRKSPESAQKCYLDVFKPQDRLIARAFRKLGPRSSLEIEISPHSHAIIRDNCEDSCILLGLLPLKEAKRTQPCYVFAAYNDKELDDLTKLQVFVENLCEIKSFEVNVDSNSNSSLPSGCALLHIYEHTACLISRSPSIRILHKWHLIEPLAGFQWERHGFHIVDLHEPNKHCFLYVNSQKDIQLIQKEIANNCKMLYTNNNVIPSPAMNFPEDLAIVSSSSQPTGNSCNDISLNREPLQINGPQSCQQNSDNLSPISKSPQYNGFQSIPQPPFVDNIQQSYETNALPESETVSTRCRSTSSALVKENVVIRYPPGHAATRRCNSDTTIQKSHKEQVKLYKSNSMDIRNDKNRSHEHEMHSFLSTSTSKEDDSSKMERKNINSMINPPSIPMWKSEIISTVSDHEIQYQNEVTLDLRPKVYMYMNITNMEEQKAANSYVNIFSGSSFKGCYENWQHQSSIYSTIPAATLPPPIPPRQHPPKLPPRLHQPGIHHCFVPQRPPPLPPKQKSPKSSVKVYDTTSSSTPRIQVALFAAAPVSGRVWFLRVAFMHQDENDTTIKRVKDIEAFSNHSLLKTNSLEVTSDIIMKVIVNSEQGFVLLNGNQQNVELSDIEDLRKGDWFIVEFHIQNSDDTQDHLIGNVSIDPSTASNCRRACRADMGIDKIFQKKAIHSFPLDTQTRQPLLSDYNRRQKLCRALDITIHSQCHDWRQVAGSLGFTHAEILELQDKACRSVTFSPTDAVLSIWEQREPNCNIDKLVNILRELGRLDVVQDLGYSITLES